MEIPSRRYSSTDTLFGDQEILNSRHSYDKNDDKDDYYRSSGFSRFFFGFMWEDSIHEEIDNDEFLHSKGDEHAPVWNALNFSLFVAYCLSTAATSVPVTLVPAASESLLIDQQDASAFVPRATASAVLGTACGKFLNGPIVDVLGARRTAVIYSILLAVSLLWLSVCQTPSSALWGFFFVEFCQSVQWPCIIVILASHYRRCGHAVYEGGVYVTSLASRVGALIGIPVSSLLLRRTHWRIVALLGAWVALISSSVSYLYVTDSPGKKDDPQNPIDPSMLRPSSVNDYINSPCRTISDCVRYVKGVVRINLLPSLRHVFRSGTFWIVALAHAGASMVRTSERILGTYFRDTSMGSLTENRAGGLAVFLSFGTIFGLMMAGSTFRSGTERERKRLVSKLYVLTIASCYLMALLSIPWLRVWIASPGLVLWIQVIASFLMGFGIAVQFYQIPSLVGATFGCDKGMYAAYTEGVAYALASIVWRIVGNAVEGGNPYGAGWAYGWAAVALLVILCAILMVEFMEHYFVRPSGRYGAGYETIIFA